MKFNLPALRVSIDPAPVEAVLGKIKSKVQVSEKEQRITIIQSATKTPYITISITELPDAVPESAYPLAIKPVIEQNNMEIVEMFLEVLHGKTVLFIIARRKDQGIVYLTYWTPFARVGLIEKELIGVASGIRLFNTIDFIRTIEVERLA